MQPTLIHHEPDLRACLAIQLATSLADLQMVTKEREALIASCLISKITEWISHGGTRPVNLDAPRDRQRKNYHFLNKPLSRIPALTQRIHARFPQRNGLGQ